MGGVVSFFRYLRKSDVKIQGTSRAVLEGVKSLKPDTYAVYREAEVQPILAMPISLERFVEIQSGNNKKKN